MKNVLGSAIALAASTHEEQMDKGGKAYILHPIRMMMRLRTDDEELMAIAILHDVVEDSELNIRDLMEMGYSMRIIAGVDAMTRKDGETYDEFIKRCALNPDARRVKREDLRDNSDITRLKGLRKKDFERLEKYSRSFIYLSD
jgi:(p)ppGpp synthase/HD superfamily hydrolase